MTSEEAAATLFGSEYSGPDVFATLGAESTSPHPSTDDLFSSEDSQQNDTYKFPSGTQSYHSDFVEYSSKPPETQIHVSTAASPSSEQRQWNEVASNGSGSTYPLLCSAQLTESLSPTNVKYDTYTPSSYPTAFISHSSYDAYDPPMPVRPPTTTRSPYAIYGLAPPGAQHAAHVAYDHGDTIAATTPPPLTAHIPVPPTVVEPAYGDHDLQEAANHDGYDLPAFANRAEYRPYEPLASNPSTSQPIHQPFEPHSYSVPNSIHGTYNAPTPATRLYEPPVTSYHPTQPLPPASPFSQIDVNSSIPLAIPVQKSTISRPKVSNAYDPPFPTVLPTRRATRQGIVTAQQAYAQYQNATNYSAHAPEASPFDTDVHHNQFTIPQESQRSSTPSHTSNVIVGHHSSDERHFVPEPATFADLYGYNPANFASTEGLLMNKHTAEIHPTDRAFVYNSQEEAALEGILEESSDTGKILDETLPPLPHNSTPNGSQPSLNSKQFLITSLSSIPLPYSPPIEGSKEPAKMPLLSSGSVSKIQSPYIPQVAAPATSRKDSSANKDALDSYAVRNTNSYVPRTSSPLSTYSGHLIDAKKVIQMKPSIVNSPPYGIVAKQLDGITVPPNPYNMAMSSSIDNQNRQASQPIETRTAPQELLMKPAVGQYAPSPSLIGANDPLSRTSARAPVVTFGFGGKLITCFHGMPGLNTGFDVAFSSRTTSELKIRILHKTLSESSLTATESSYPGPLLVDSGTASISLVRPNTATQTRTKKASVLNYLSGRISEIQQGLGYLSGSDGQMAENKLILVKLLNVMVDNNGRLLGTPQAEAAVRSTLVPRLEGAPVIQDAVSLHSSYKVPVLDEVPISVTTLRPSALDKIEELLLLGDRRQAYQFAMEQKLWAHAMVVASSIDKESWKDVVHDFLRSELAAKAESDITLGVNGKLPHSSKGNRESLRVAYSLFSGQGSAAIEELAPLTLLQRGLGGHFHPPTMPAMTPRTPNFNAMQTSNLPLLPVDSLTAWAETVAMMISSPLTPEASSALTALGDQLIANDWVEAAHVCYLLSPQTSLFGGLGSASARLTLIGAKNPADVMKHPDSLTFSEILEFAMSLVPVSKGQEAFHGIPHLQAYRFIRAIQLAEVGQIQLANKYCDAVNASLSHASSYSNFALLEQLQGLQQRLSGVFPGEKGGSWIGGKLTKPSLDSFGGWLEGTFTKIVTGQSEIATSASDHSKSIDQPFVGPFAHYSTISSNTPSARSSPQPQPPAGYNAPPQRTSSAMATSTPYSQQTQVERSSSAMGYSLQRPTIQTQGSSNSLSSSQSSPVGSTLNNLTRGLDHYTPKTHEFSTGNDVLETPVQTSWWGSSNAANEESNTPKAATFMKVDESSVQASNDGFISLMDSQTFSVGPAKYVSSAPPIINEDEDDDLGLGNSKSKPKQAEESSSTKDEADAEASKPSAEPAKTEEPRTASTSWLGRWFKRSESTPAPIKASLGEESAFYYDKEQKRWVNRKANDEAASKSAAPPPPPSRAQTASPGMSASKLHPPANAPPVRPASAVDLAEPGKTPMRVRSNLGPPMESAPSTPTGTRQNPPSGPPPVRPKSQATKRNVRSRYVDVFQQEGGGSA